MWGAGLHQDTERRTDGRNRGMTLSFMSRELAHENSLLDKIDALMEEGLSESAAVSVAVAEEIEPDYDEE